MFFRIFAQVSTVSYLRVYKLSINEMNSNKEISAPEAIGLMADENTIIIDIRNEINFMMGHIDGAVHMDNSNFPLFVQDTPKDKTIIVVCYHGNSSLSVAQYLHTQGFKNAFSLIGGYEEWPK